VIDTRSSDAHRERAGRLFAPEADVLRKSGRKKIKELNPGELGSFVKRAIARGHDKKTVEEIAAQIETFGRYGFNKSHSVAYSILSYQTRGSRRIIRRVHGALLSSEIGNTDRVVQYINEARELDLQVLHPTERVRLQVPVVGIGGSGSGWVRCAMSGRAQSPPSSRDGIGTVPHTGRVVRPHRSALCNKRVIESLSTPERVIPSEASARSWSRPWILRSASTCAAAGAHVGRSPVRRGYAAAPRP